jgi:antirestriction protein
MAQPMTLMKKSGGSLKREGKTTMTKLYANPYDISAGGFYFDTAEEYNAKADKLRNDYGDPVEEFEIDFIDGELIDCELAEAWGINQGNFSDFFEKCDEWEISEKVRFIIAVGECGFDADEASNNPYELDIDIYEEQSMHDLAQRFVEEGLFGEIPESLAFYIDYDAIARDLSVDYSQTTINGGLLIFRCM